MGIAIGQHLGSYEIIALLGKGGMGEVYRARDTKLKREVAIKILPDEFSSDPSRVSRFQREAEVLASLNYANIAAIYDLQEVNDTRFLVLELVEGETLADVIRRGPILPEEALKLSLQIVSAVEAAHERGVVHRDLKPANIKITPDGKVKVLDFGLAKALQQEQDLSNSPTLSIAATGRGVILGTAAYVSPEQARGITVDGRTDVWAFGCVLYEMLTGRQAFRGEMVSDILASVLARDPDFTSLRTNVHPRIHEIVQRCLEKDPKHRWQAIGDVRVEIEVLLASKSMEPVGESVATSPKGKPRVVLPWVAVAAVVAAAATWALKPAPPSDPQPITRFDYELPESLRTPGRRLVAFSPDGRHFAYNTTRGIFLRSLDSLTARLIPGTEEAVASPFFSPDGEWIAYVKPVPGELRKISIAGGVPTPICPTNGTLFFDASWGTDGNILFTESTGILRVSANGGTPELVVKTKPGETVHGPSMLPDGKTVLYTLTRVQGADRWDQAEIIVQQVGSSDAKVVWRGGSDARYISSGHLVFAVGNNLFAVPFDIKTLQVKGGQVPMVQGVQRSVLPAVNDGTANFGVSDRGTLVYLNATISATPQSVLGIVDRNGAVRRLNMPPGNYRSPRVSPDGRQVAVESAPENGQSIIWVYDLSGNTAIRRLTQDGNNTRPIWSRNGKKIAYGSDRERATGIYWQEADGSGLPERLTNADEGFLHFPESFSPDGRVLSFARVQAPVGPTGFGLWTLAMDSSEKKPTLFYDVPMTNEFGSEFSPDGKWIAYASNEGSDAQFGIYVQPYPPTGVKYEISRNGGAWPLWSPSGGELFYRLNVGTLSSSAKIKSVSITTKSVPSFKSEQELPIQGFLPFVFYREYDILPNGREFIMVFPAAQGPASDPPRPRINVVLNWFRELQQRVPVK